jgi:hypothetical protein
MVRAGRGGGGQLEVEGSLAEELEEVAMRDLVLACLARGLG